MIPSENVVIAVHSLFARDDRPVSGTGASLFELLRKGNIRFSVCHLPIYGNHRICIETHGSQGDHVDRSVFMPASFMIRIIMEAYVMLRIIVSKQKIPIYIGVDPLNALWGIIGKYVFHKIDSVVFYTADYSPNRFANFFLNRVYHTIDSVCTSYADQVWNVSTRIYELRRVQGVPDQRNYFIPNSPIVLRRPTVKRHRNWITIVGTSTTALDYEVIIRALPKLVNKYPDIRLHIIGDLNFEPGFQKILNIWKNKKIVVLHGPLSRHDVFTLLTQSGIGLALYTNKDPWTQFGDSMKVREYLSAGLPVIMTNNVSTSDVIGEYKCGEVIPLSDKDFLHAIDSIYTSLYAQMSRRAFDAAQQYSYDRMVRTPLSAVGINV